MKRKAWALGFLLLLLALYGCEGNSSATKISGEESQPALRVTVTPVRVQKVQRTVDFVGTLSAYDEVTVSSEVEGRIASVAADLGDRVSRGQLLAKIEDTEFRLAVEQTREGLRETLSKLGLEKLPPPDFDVTRTSSVMKAQAELENAQVNLKRMKTLFDEQIISAQEYDSAETRYKTALSAYKNANEEARALVAAAYVKEAQMRTAQKKLKDTVIAAPIGGSVSKRFVSAGEYVKVAAPLFTLVQDHPLKLRGMIPERFAPEVQAGQAVEVKVDAFAGQLFKGRLTRISPSVEVASRSFLVEGLVDNPERRLKPGFFGKAVILTKVDPNALTVPLQALVTFAGVSKVFVVENNRVARERVVRTGVRVGQNEIEITQGLKPGELVVVSGLARLTDGAPVRVSGPVMPKEKEGKVDEPR